MASNKPEGWRRLRDAGIRLRDFPPELRSEIRADNAEFLDSFRWAKGESGTHTFDYQLNAGELLLGPRGGEIKTRWSVAGQGLIHAYDHDYQHVALARFATRPEEVDNPGALDFSSYTVPVHEGGVVVSRNDRGYAIVRVDRVLSGPTYELTLTYELRLRRGTPVAGEEPAKQRP